MAKFIISVQGRIRLPQKIKNLSKLLMPSSLLLVEECSPACGGSCLYVNRYPFKAFFGGAFYFMPRFLIDTVVVMESFITISLQHNVVFLSGIMIITLFYTLLISNLGLILCSVEFF